MVIPPASSPVTMNCLYPCSGPGPTDHMRLDPIPQNTDSHRLHHQSHPFSLTSSSFPLFWIILGSMKMSFYLPYLRQKPQQTPSLESSNPHCALHFIAKFFSSLSTPMLSWTNPIYTFSLTTLGNKFSQQSSM